MECTRHWGDDDASAPPAFALPKNGSRLSIYDRRPKRPRFEPAMIRLALRPAGKRKFNGAAA
jgi:hypothetical protein